MIGLIILIVGVIYLTVLVAVTRAAYRGAKNKGFSKAKCRFAAAGGFLALYLPIFWDHIPTVIAHEYYCTKDSGFWIYKTLDQWKTENPGVAETLLANKSVVTVPNAYVLNHRFNWAVYETRYFPINHMTRTEWQVVDSKTEEILARYVNYSASHEKRQAGWTGWKFWLDSPYCISARKNEDAFRLFRDGFRGERK
ncbi:MAG: hypothetical protein Q8M53_08905 [Burkholderiales bacterium]|nr:hypothetical protein [Burkholderiales bacterium]MDP3714920.1 hypothetical protein [Burkholderiales bacterium]